MSFFTSHTTTPDAPVPFLEPIGCDLHLHVLPGIDDGSPSLDESLEIIGAHYEAGLRKIIATPHIRSDFFPNTHETIREAWEQLHPVALDRWPDLTLTYAAEHFADDYLMVLLEQESLLPLFGRYVLVETSMRVEQPFFMEVLRAMISAGWQPVLAHPERYRPWHNQPDRYAELREMNVIFQINLLSLGGAYGTIEKTVAEWIIQKGWAGAVGTDLHRANQHHLLRKATQTPHFQTLCQMPLLNHLVHTHEERH
jgi:protein-tyrosine phosphatase